MSTTVAKTVCFSKTDQITIFVERSGAGKTGTLPIMVGKVNARRARFMSKKVQEQIFKGGYKGVKVPNAVKFDSSKVDADSARCLIKWMGSFTDGQPLTRDFLEEKTFSATVRLYAAGYTFEISRNKRSDNLRDAIRADVEKLPLSLSEVKCVCELLPFDTATIDMMLGSLAKSKRDGHPVPQMPLIEKYLASMNMTGYFADGEAEAITDVKSGQNEQIASPVAPPANVFRGPAGKSWAQMAKY